VLLIGDEGSFKDFNLSVKFKTVSGEIDRTAGLVFRVKDANNYYAVHVNALEDKYRLYHVVAGKRHPFAGANFAINSGEWHELRVECIGDKIICYFDGVKKIEATVETFRDAGKVGLWTKADSVTYFDDLRVAAKYLRSEAQSSAMATGRGIACSSKDLGEHGVPHNAVYPNAVVTANTLLK